MKTKLSVLLLTLSLTACNIMDSATINSQAAQSYRQTVSQAQEHRMIDTTSNTAKRVQRVFQKLVPYATAANTTGQPFQWEMNVIRSDELNAWAMLGAKWWCTQGLWKS